MDSKGIESEDMLDTLGTRMDSRGQSGWMWFLP